MTEHTFDRQLSGIVLDAPDPRALAAFYRDLLGWTTYDEDDTWVRIGPLGDGRPSLSFQLEPTYVAPTWPSGTDAPQMQVHLDIQVSDLDNAVAFAEARGARRADYQPQAGVRVMIDPVGHVFCLFLPGW
jgi:catechol 2,3-dioxygenase-like lactoylglutathione lyase family enzyme